MEFIKAVLSLPISRKLSERTYSSAHNYIHTRARARRIMTFLIIYKEGREKERKERRVLSPCSFTLDVIGIIERRPRYRLYRY